MSEALRAAAIKALEALEAIEDDPHGTHSFPALSYSAITALRAALAEPTPGENAQAHADRICRKALAEPAGEPDPGCPDCNGTGARDSGGTTPWGEAIFLPCDCRAHPPQRTPVPAGEPVAWLYVDDAGKGHRHISERSPSSYDPQDLADAEVFVTPLYTHPPQRKPLSQDDLLDAFCKTPGVHQFVEAFVAGARFAEAQHGIKESSE